MRRVLVSGAIVFLLALVMIAPAQVSAQAQSVAVTPGYINLGMTTQVVVTAPAAGSFTVVVQQPNGTESSLSFVPTSANQVLNATYGNSTVGFKSVVDQVGTYNVFLEQGGQVVSSTTFYSTNKLLVSMDMVNGGACAYIAGATRGTKMFPRFYVYYASNGAPVTNLDPGVYVNYTLPDGAVANAGWDHYSRLFVGQVLPNWNYTYVGPWTPTAVVGDAAGNTAVYQYAGNPFVISPVQLSTSVAVVNAATGSVTTTLSNGVGVTIEATLAYPSNAEPVTGFVGLLNTTRGGVVTAQIGWGYYNATSGAFGGSAPGGLLATVGLTYSSNGTWTGNFTPSSLPALSGGSTFLVVITAHDSASPANTGFGTEALSLAPTSTTSTVTQTTSTETVTQQVQTIPSVVYAALAILLIVGLLIGYIVRVPR